MNLLNFLRHHAGHRSANRRRLPCNDPESIELGREFASYLSTVSARTPASAQGGSASSTSGSSSSATSYQCLICHSVQRDLFNLRNHVVNHMSEDSPVIQRLDRYIAPNILQQGPSCFTCFICKKPIKRRYKEVRTHFVAKHLGSFNTF